MCGTYERYIHTYGSLLFNSRFFSVVIHHGGLYLSIHFLFLCREYIDLTRNQLILRELVTRRGLPVLNNIPSGLQRTKEILAGFRDPPSNIASILV